MILQNAIGSLVELYIGGGNSWITQSAPTNFHKFWKRKGLVGSETPADFKEVTDAEKTVLEKTDAAWERPPQEFIDRWNYKCDSNGKFNEKTGYFELNGLVDIPYNEAIGIDAFDTNLLVTASDPEAFNDRWRLTDVKLRTVIPIKGRSVDCYLAGQYNSSIDIWAFGKSGIKMTSNAELFKGGGFPDVVKILPYIQMTVSDKKYFANCPRLTSVKVFRLRINLDLSVCPLLDYESVFYMVNNAINTTAITIYVHADVMAKLNTSDFVIPDGKRLIASAVAVERERTKAQWQALASRDEDYWTGAPVETLGIKAGDIVLVGGKCTDSTSEFATIYFQVTEVDGTTITGKNLSLFFNSWEVIRRMASAKNITFATLT